MKRICSLIMLSGALVSAAAEPADSIPAQQLQEVTVDAPRVVRKADMDVYYPSEGAVATSANGLQLLSGLMIPGVTVVDALSSVTASGESVQIRINGNTATVDKLRSLLPETIKRIEWIDNPGLRYGGASRVLNVIVVNPTLGGSLMLSARQAVNDAWGFYDADLAINSGRSQWSAGGFYKLTENLEIGRRYAERFTYPDGSSLTRTESPLSGNLCNSFARAWLSYNYIKPDTTVLDVTLEMFDKVTDKWDYTGLLRLSNGEPDVKLTDRHGDTGVTPELSVYFEHHLPRRQTLVVDASASLFSGDSGADYVEHLQGQEAPVTDVHTHIRDFNRAYGIEADYIKEWQKSRFTAGASYTANRNRSKYRNLDGRVFHQRQDKAYFFAEYFHRIGRVSLTGGLGAQYTSFRFRETGQGRSSWNLRPQASAVWTPAQGHQIRLAFTSWQDAPSLAQTNIVPQQIDGFQWQVGNPDLRISSFYRLSLRYAFNLPRVYASFSVVGFSAPDIVAPRIYRDGARLINSFENSRGEQSISFGLSPQIEVVPGWFTLSGNVLYCAERSRGTGYRHVNHDWSYDATASVSHWGFAFTAQYRRAQRDLWGETVSWGEDLNIMELSYNIDKWKLSAGVIMPFGNYDQGTRSLNRWNSNERHLQMDMRLFFLSVSYNLQWGRQKDGVDKLINNGSSVDTSKAANR